MHLQCTASYTAFSFSTSICDSLTHSWLTLPYRNPPSLGLSALLTLLLTLSLGVEELEGEPDPDPELLGRPLGPPNTLFDSLTSQVIDSQVINS